MRKRLIAFVVLVAAAELAVGSESAALIAQGDEEERQRRPEAALALFQKAEQFEPNNPALLVKIARQYAELVPQTRPAKAAQQRAEKSLEYARRAVKNDPKNAQAHLRMAIAYGKLTDFVPNKRKLEYSKRIKEEAARSIELDPKDDLAWHILGRWHAGIANVNGMMKAMANLIYGGLPAASNEEALKCLKRAAELAPQRIYHHSELARVYTQLGQTELAGKEWQTVLGLPVVDEEDRKDQREAREVLRVR
jgi:tetratricopeptide (TPR) repeat protein